MYAMSSIISMRWLQFYSTFRLYRLLVGNKNIDYTYNDGNLRFEGQSKSSVL